MRDDDAPPAWQLTADFVTMVEGLFGAVREQAALLAALLNYQRAQSTFKQEEFDAVYAAERARLELPPLGDVDAGLQALLRAFKGPPH